MERSPRWPCTAVAFCLEGCRWSCSPVSGRKVRSFVLVPPRTMSYPLSCRSLSSSFCLVFVCVPIPIYPPLPTWAPRRRQGQGAPPLPKGSRGNNIIKKNKLYIWVGIGAALRFITQSHFCGFYLFRRVYFSPKMFKGTLAKHVYSWTK